MLQGQGGSTAPTFAGGAGSLTANNDGFGGFGGFGGGGGSVGGGGGGGYSGGGGGGDPTFGGGAGYGGSFAADFTDLGFSNAGNAGHNGFADIELLVASLPAGTVSEPASVALVFAGLAILLPMRRRNRASR